MYPQVPLYPDASAAPSFTKSSGMVYFGLPTRNGQLVDKWRVEWSTDSSFSPVATHQAVLLLPQVSYNPPPPPPLCYLINILLSHLPPTQHPIGCVLPTPGQLQHHRPPLPHCVSTPTFSVTYLLLNIIYLLYCSYPRSTTTSLASPGG